MDHKEYFLSCIQRWGSNWRQEAWRFAHSRKGLYPAMCNGAVDGNPFSSNSEYEPEDLAEIYAKVMRNFDEDSPSKPTALAVGRIGRKKNCIACQL